MENSNDLTFETFREKLQKLNPQVKEKALSIAKELLEKEKYRPEEAIDEGIRRAEEWLYDLEG